MTVGNARMQEILARIACHMQSLHHALRSHVDFRSECNHLVPLQLVTRELE
jgi:hypothetical protein